MDDETTSRENLIEDLMAMVADARKYRWLIENYADELAKIMECHDYAFDEDIDQRIKDSGCD
jgi:hypothetical protein